MFVSPIHPSGLLVSLPRLVTVALGLTTLTCHSVVQVPQGGAGATGWCRCHRVVQVPQGGAGATHPHAVPQPLHPEALGQALDEVLGEAV